MDDKNVMNCAATPRKMTAMAKSRVAARAGLRR
jgi:hypothetical protein